LKRLFQLAVAVFLAFLAVAAHAAENPRAAFESANSLYYEGKFQQSAAVLQSLITNGYTSAESYFNLGNAFYKSDQVGRAIVAYRQAASLKPRDADIRANLRFARRQASGPPGDQNLAERAINKMTANEWAVAFSIFLWGLFGTLAFRQWKPAPGRAPGWVYLLFTLGLLVAGAGMSIAIESQHISKVAVTIVPSAPVRQGPHDSAQAVYTARDGVELPVIDHKDAWLLVRIDREHFGWMLQKNVILCSGKYL
jgi:tetratricopeptide (TPR) repeat protein